MVSLLIGSQHLWALHFFCQKNGSEMFRLLEESLSNGNGENVCSLKIASLPMFLQIFPA